MEVTDSKRALKILYVITKANWGGAQRYVYDLALASQQAGHEVIVACGSKGELTERLSASHIPTLLVQGLGRDVAPLQDLHALREFTRLMQTVKPDVAHLNSSKAGLLGAIAAHRARVPRIIFTAHGWAFNESRPWWQKAIFAIFHVTTVWAADIVICVSKAVEHDAAWMLFSKKKFVVIHNGIEPGYLLSKTEARQKLAPDLSVHTWIGTIAELHPTKGLDVLIEAFKKIAPQFPDIALVLIGEGQAREYLQSLVPLDLQARVRFAGHVSNAAETLSALSIFAFPSRSEALGFALLEAGNASLPSVATNVGGIPEIIQDGENGLLVGPNDSSALAAALTYLLSHPEKASGMGTTLHEKVLREFSKAQMIQKTLALY
jgi:glycosyltransferase involved in cell wall biosynthesis